jgi:hypothetical protein
MIEKGLSKNIARLETFLEIFEGRIQMTIQKAAGGRRFLVRAYFLHKTPFEKLVNRSVTHELIA